MLRLSFFIVAFIIIGGYETLSVLTLSDYDVIHVVANHNSCSRKDVERWANVFVNCFVNRKNLFKTRRDLYNIVARLLDRSKSCIKFATLECRPDYDGFLNIMGKVMEMIKGYSIMHVERLTRAGLITYAERGDKIIDLNCVEESLTIDTYATCFSSVISAYKQLGENETYDLIYQKEVEMAILCTNIAKSQCSKSVKIDLNKVVRYILGVKQPEKEDIEDDRMLSSPTETPKSPSELLKAEKGNDDDNYVTLKLPDSTSHSESTQFLEAEKEKLKSSFKNTKLSESHDFRERKNDNDQEFRDHTKSFKFTEIFIFNEQTTILNLAKSGKENNKNDPKISGDLEFLETSTLSEHSKIGDVSKALESVKSTEIPNLEDSPNSTNFDDSKNLDVSETGKDMGIDILNWTAKFTASTESQKPTEQFKASTFLNLEKKSNDLHLTEPTEFLKDKVAPKSKDLANSTDLDASKDHVVENAGKNTMTEPATMDFEEEFTASTKPPKLIELPRTTESTKPPISVDILISTTSTKPPISTEHPKTTTTAKPPKSTELKKTTMSTNSPKTTELPRTIRSTKLPKHIEHSTTISTKTPKPTERSRTTTSRKPSKPTERPRTTTTTRHHTFSSVVSRSRDETPRPTEAPRPWYDFIVRPFVSLWRTIKSWFGW